MWRASPSDWIGRNYRVEEDGETIGTVQCGPWSCGIVLDGQSLTIVREGSWNPRFHLVREQQRLATASSVGVFRRSFQIVQGEETYNLAPTSIWCRSFALTRNDTYLGMISSAGTFSRAALIGLDPELAPELCLFAFWMVALAWRRGAATVAAT